MLTRITEASLTGWLLWTQSAIIPTPEDAIKLGQGPGYSKRNNFGNGSTSRAQQCGCTESLAQARLSSPRQ